MTLPEAERDPIRVTKDTYCITPVRSKQAEL